MRWESSSLALRKRVLRLSPGAWRKLAGRAAAHFVLLCGVVLFGFPFYWLLSTSVKEDEEIFADPPKWIPSMPREVPVSPYIAAEEFPQPQPPPGASARTWAKLWPKIEGEIWRRVRERWPAEVGRFAEDEVRGALVAGLWHTIAVTLPEAQAEERLRNFSSLLDRYISQSNFRKVWRRIYRSLEIRDPVVQDVGFVDHPLARRPLSFDAWRAKAGALSLERRAGGVEKPSLVFHYDFRRDGEVWATAEFPLPIAKGEFKRFTLPLRSDKSWHRVDIELDVGGDIYRSAESFVLYADLWQEVAWQMPEAKGGRTLFRDYVPLRLVRRAKVGHDKLRVKLVVRRSSRLRVAYEKAARNYRAALNFIPLGCYLWNTIILVVLNVCGQLFSCSLVAYSFARLRWPGRDGLFALLLATMMLPGQVTMIPVFLIYRALGWYNTLQPLWVGSLFGSAFFIFMLRQFMRTIPLDLEDAAKIDGCSFFGLYWRIVLPLMKPALAAVAIFTFMGTWNEFMGPLIYLNDQRLYPLSLGLYQFRIEHGTDFGMLMSASTIMTLPVVFVFFLAQKHFIQGVTLTGMKG